MAAGDTAGLLSEDRRWERWTIDEILDERVRVVACEARRPVHPQAASLVDGLGLTEGGSDPDAVTTSAMAIELAPAEETWTDERGAVVEEAALTALLRGRTAGGGLPSERPLREGDVFWLFVPTEVAVLTGQADAAGLASYQDAGTIVLDLTAAARQAAKHRVHRVEQPTDETGAPTDG